MCSSCGAAAAAQRKKQVQCQYLICAVIRQFMRLPLRSRRNADTCGHKKGPSNTGRPKSVTSILRDALPLKLLLLRRFGLGRGILPGSAVDVRGQLFAHGFGENGRHASPLEFLVGQKAQAHLAAGNGIAL